MSVHTQRLALLGVLALVPVAAYWGTVERVANEPVLAAVCVLLVVGSLWRMLSPADGTGTTH